MAGQGKEQSGLKVTTPLLGNDLENASGTTTADTTGEKKQTLWEWTKAEVACYSKKLKEDFDRFNSYGPDHVSPRWKNARSSRFV